MLMDNILQELQRKKCWKSSLKTQCRRNSIDPSYASAFTIVKLKKFFENPPQLQASGKPRMKSSVWLQNQLKAYQWLCICLSTVKGILIRDFSQNQWSLLSNIFNKDQSILEYEAIKLISEKEGTKRRWEEEQSRALFQIIRKEPQSNKWNQIARTLFIQSRRKYFRSGKQCRERWFNHLDPSKKKGQWQPAEDRFIAEFILNKGKKWSEIAKLLQFQRTQHMIKNRFKTIMIKLKKEYPEVKNESQLLKNLLYQNIDDGSKQPQQNINHQEEKRINNFHLNDVPIIEDENENLDFQFDIKEQEIMDRINPTNFDFQQVVTPCPIIYQSFTPTFLNTPHPLPFLCSFGKFQKDDNLFLKNN